MLLGKVTWPSMKKVNHTSQKGLLVPDTKNNNRDNVQKHSLDPVLVFWCVNWRALSLTSEYSGNLSTAEALLTVNLVNDKLCLRPPSQNPVFLNSQASSRPAPDTDWIYASCSTKSSDWHYSFNSLNYHFAIHSPANFAGLLSVCYYYIDTDEIPGFFRWRKFGIQWRQNFYLSYVKISRLSWLLQSQPIGNYHHTIARVHGFFIHKSCWKTRWIFKWTTKFRHKYFRRRVKRRDWWKVCSDDR